MRAVLFVRASGSCVRLPRAPGAGLSHHPCKAVARAHPERPIAMKTLHSLLVLLVMFCAAPPALAQAPVVGARDPESLFTSPDPKLHASKQVVLHIMRDLLEAGHRKDAPKSLTNKYIQHTPTVAAGLEPVMKFFAGREVRPIPDRNSWRTKVVAVTAEADRVVVAILRELDDP